MARKSGCHPRTSLIPRTVNGKVPSFTPFGQFPAPLPRSRFSKKIEEMEQLRAPAAQEGLEYATL